MVGEREESRDSGEPKTKTKLRIRDDIMAITKSKIKIVNMMF